MPTPQVAPLQLLRRFLPVLGAWTAVALTTTQLQYVVLTGQGTDVRWISLAIPNLASCWVWALMTPGIAWGAHRWPITRERWLEAGAAHVALFVGWDLIDAVVMEALLGALGDERFGVAMRAARSTFINAVSYVVIVAVAHARGYAAQVRERERREAALEHQLAVAQLHALQAQLHPHFLFNTLNAIAELVHHDPEDADRMLVRLSGLLRSSFATRPDQEVSLRDELNLVQHYLDLMGLRFRDRVTLRISADPAALDAQVPTWLLQPLVENALRHGLEPLDRPGSLEVTAERRNGHLALEVRDNGVGGPADPPPRHRNAREGLGLGHTRERLQRLYPGAHAFDVKTAPGEGFVVRIEVPYHTEADPVVR